MPRLKFYRDATPADRMERLARMKCLTLCAMLESGKVWIEEGCYVARSLRDGVVEVVGCVGIDEKTTDKFLAERSYTWQERAANV